MEKFSINIKTIPKLCFIFIAPGQKDLYGRYDSQNFINIYSNKYKFKEDTFAHKSLHNRTYFFLKISNGGYWTECSKFPLKEIEFESECFNELIQGRNSRSNAYFEMNERKNNERLLCPVGVTYEISCVPSMQI